MKAYKEVTNSWNTCFNHTYLVEKDMAIGVIYNWSKVPVMYDSPQNIFLVGREFEEIELPEF